MDTGDRILHTPDHISRMTLTMMVRYLLSTAASGLTMNLLTKIAPLTINVSLRIPLNGAGVAGTRPLAIVHGLQKRGLFILNKR